MNAKSMPAVANLKTKFRRHRSANAERRVHAAAQQQIHLSAG